MTYHILFLDVDIDFSGNVLTKQSFNTKMSLTVDLYGQRYATFMIACPLPMPTVFPW